jgi:hypothetical protein
LEAASAVVFDGRFGVVHGKHDRPARFAVFRLPDAEGRSVGEGKLGAAPLVVDLGRRHS